jgi:hypothetical protein
MCLAVLCAILVAGLWPFNPFPKNDVRWLADGNGVFFGTRSGIIVSSDPLKTSQLPEALSGSIEVWLEPGGRNDDEEDFFLSFYTPESPSQLRLGQWADELLVRHEIRDEQNHSTSAGIWVEDTFRRNRPVFVTLTSGIDGTALYINGILIRTSPDFRLSAKDFSGEIVLGTSPVRRSTWVGWMRGLAIYDRELTADQVSDHHKIWTGNGAVETLEHEAAALYRFDERAGSVVHNSGTAGPDLEIPASFKVPHGRFLEMPWDGESVSFDLPDMAVNIVGFMPFGFFSCAYLVSIGRNRHAALTAIVLGALVSLAIEILQKYIPTRDSDMMDLITNTLGAAAGTLLYRRKMIHSLLTRFGLAIE